MMALITLKDYAARHGLNATTLRHRILRGGIPEAQKLGRDWFVPEDLELTDRRVKTGEFVGLYERYGKRYYNERKKAQNEH